MDDPKPGGARRRVGGYPWHRARRLAAACLATTLATVMPAWSAAPAAGGPQAAPTRELAR